MPLVGESLPLDLVNTRPQAHQGLADLFHTAAGLQEWLTAESDRLPHARVGEATRVGVVTLRQHVGSAIDDIMAGGRPSELALHCLNEALRRAPLHPQLTWGSLGPRVDTIRQGDDDTQLFAALAEAAVEYLASDNALKTRQCEAPDCEMLFTATHPRRRWCSPTVCGNRTRVARYYERHKS